MSAFVLGVILLSVQTLCYELEEGPVFDIDESNEYYSASSEENDSFEFFKKSDNHKEELCYVENYWSQSDMEEDSKEEISAVLSSPTEFTTTSPSEPKLTTKVIIPKEHEVKTLANLEDHVDIKTDVASAVVHSNEMIDQDNGSAEKRLDLKTLTVDLMHESEGVEETERDVRESKGFEPNPYLQWFEPNPYTWLLPVFIPYAYPTPVPTVADLVSGPANGAAYKQTVPVKGKVTLVGTFNDCRWNYPQLPAVVNYDSANVASNKKYQGVIPVAGKVTIAAKFDDCGFSHIPTVPLDNIASSSKASDNTKLDETSFSCAIPVSSKITIAATFDDCTPF